MDEKLAASVLDAIAIWRRLGAEVSHGEYGYGSGFPYNEVPSPYEVKDEA